MTVEYIEADGGKLAFEVVGTGPLIICSPGLGDTRDAYDPLVGELVASGYRVARVDLRGHGDSTATFNGYGDEATAEDFLAVVQKLGGGPAVLIGASLSSAAAVIAAGRRPDQVAGLVLIAPFLRNGMGTVMRRVLHLVLMKPWGPFAWRMYAAKLWPGLAVDKAKERAASSTALLQRPGRWPAFHASSNADHRVVQPWIARVQAPVLIVIGDADPDWKDPVGEAQWVASNFSQVETITVPGAGHAPMFELPHLVSPGVLQFLEKTRAAGAFNPDISVINIYLLL
ncbi:Alpha/Beta hydrolase protein [Ilyonectria sp. MPI-CAGE-AT-0026]|nr:Alpha/Beta hydrolase protein [Ilyonectria sp. MPI-CAGE-AT-0026]